MTNSSCASGSTDGSNNLKDASYADFADYLTEVVKHYRDTWGITFRTLEPLNEPNASWWKANGGQEGCHFSPANQQQIVKAVGASLTAKGLTGTTVSASDENSLDDAYNNLRGYDAASLAVMSQMNSHSYSGAATSRPNLRALATSKAKRLWQSESGPLSVTLADAHRRRAVHGGADHHRPARSAAAGLDRLAGRRPGRVVAVDQPRRQPSRAGRPSSGSTCTRRSAASSGRARRCWP